MPGDHLPLALFSFNLGVEAGQAAVVLAAIPILHLLSGTDRSRFAVSALLSVIGGHAAWHLLESRVSELSRAWAISGGAPPSWSWFLWPLALAGCRRVGGPRGAAAPVGRNANFCLNPSADPWAPGGPGAARMRRR